MDFRLAPSKSVAMMASPQMDGIHTHDSSVTLHAPDKLQPVRRGPSRAAGAHGLDVTLKSDQRLVGPSPEPLRPVQFSKGGGSLQDGNKDKIKKPLDHSFNKETFL